MDETAKKEKSEVAKREEQVLSFWKENRTFEKTLEKEAPEGEFVFYDGPPFATGLPHHGSLLSSITKDVVPRYKTMRGYRVRRRWGWDCHGLPIESLVEKELGLKTKKDIEAMGIEAFNEKARSMVLTYVHDWKEYIERIGRFVDFENSYKTMDSTYIESVFWALKELWNKQLLYEGKRVLMYCPHCETPLAKAEIAMDNTYQDVTEEAITVKFKVKNPEKYGLPENTYLLAWTTTPWTLPGNVALAVGEKISYVLVREGDAHLILAKERNKDREYIQEMMGSEVVGLEYEQIYDIPALQSATSHKVYAADFVSTEDGTGIVHIAPMYGEDDFALGQKAKLPMVQLLKSNGTYNNDVPGFLEGKYLRDAQKDIKNDLNERGLLFARNNHTHSYPHCYRCGTPLIYNAVPSWFINIQQVKERMLEENEKVNWIPDHLKHGRFKNIVESAPDWTISRNRFWASPLPIWKNEKGEVYVMGSLDEIKRHTKKRGNSYFIMRHGEAQSNIANVADGDGDAENVLTEFGKTKVRETAQSLGKVDWIVTSPIPRARATAELMADEMGIPRDRIVTEERLREINFGEFEGKDISGYEAFFLSWAERMTKKPKGGETWKEMKRRMAEFLYGWDEEHEGVSTLVVSHRGPLEMLQAAARGLTDEQTANALADGKIALDRGEAREIEFVPLPHNRDYELDYHRPYIDEIELVDDNGGKLTRIPEVIDCWVESGAMPFAEWHYPFENKERFESRFPGDFIAEYIAQTRTWFYYMHAMGLLLFSQRAFKNVLTTGTILAADGQKISKSKRNYTDPLALINQYGADALRFSLMSSPVMQAEDLRFRDEDVRDAYNRVVQMLWNTFKFFELYKDQYGGKAQGRESNHILDRWIFARLDQTVTQVTDAFEAYDLPLGCRTLRDFIEDYSTWYVRRSRERVKGEDLNDKQHALATQKEVLETLARLLAPVIPFTAESLWQGIGNIGSVHLEGWPESRTAPESVLEQMADTRKVISAGLEARQRAGLKVRQPLSKLSLKDSTLRGKDEYIALIQDEVNVKAVEFDASISTPAELDTVLTPELVREGMARDLVRQIQDLRKEIGFTPQDMVYMRVATTGEGETFVGEFSEYLKKATLARYIEFKEGEGSTKMEAGTLSFNVSLEKAS